ncbi:transcriptional regulator [Corynebacterium atypicum]|uniref:Transcriptional regulator n=1 Tax=Corynebacterium atypicum TaxID=191610 RepID=A0ABM5QP54_9CORY|nr:LacI family DNA-binding transcriptional regulator [Corynebacterium atypicum]AIG64588.1 transcriptional regulator [Corynebacterium atypicum]
MTRQQHPEPQAKHNVTIYDVAAAAGVSSATVSRALNRPERVSFATAEKVRAAAIQVGYRSTLATRQELPGQRTGNLGVIVADIANPFFAEIVRGAEHAARVADFQVLVANIDEVKGRTRTAAEAIIPHVDALLLASARLSNADITKLARRIPTVSLNRPVPGVPSVLVDNYEGAIKAVIHLSDLDVRTITYIGGPHGAWADSTRLRGILDAVGRTDGGEEVDTFTRSSQLASEVRHKLARISAHQLRAEAPTILGGRRAFARWRRDPTDAVLCYNDLVALGFMQQARFEGWKVPDDVAVIGFDNTELTALSQPSLTTVAGPLRSVGRVAAANAMALVMGKRGPLSRPRVLPTRLIERESTGRPRR